MIMCVILGSYDHPWISRCSRFVGPLSFVLHLFFFMPDHAHYYFLVHTPRSSYGAAPVCVPQYDCLSVLLDFLFLFPCRISGLYIFCVPRLRARSCVCTMNGSHWIL